jgi:hypothetical protein
MRSTQAIRYSIDSTFHETDLETIIHKDRKDPMRIN